MIDALTPKETRQTLDSPERQVAVIDIREPLEYSRGHIRESTLVPRRDLEFRLPFVVPDGRATIVLVDQYGERVVQDADWLEFLGYEDVAYLDGGIDAWTTAGFETIEAHEGVYATAFNFPSKDFGEQVQVEESVEQLQPEDLKAMLDGDEDVLVTDVRTPEEFKAQTIPGALNVEGVDIGLYVEQLRDREQTVVVNCAGRTRSIIGTASLKKLGFENVYELENGTMGWELAGYELERDADRHVSDIEVDGDKRAEIRANSVALLEENDVPLLSVDEFEALQTDESKLVYAVDVRTVEEYNDGHLPGSLSIPGGQAIQTADEHFPVRNGTIVFISDDHVRAAITAYWFDRMGYPKVTVLEGGIEAWQAAGHSLEIGPDRRPPAGRDIIEEHISTISPGELTELQGVDNPLIVDIGPSKRFEGGHIPSARWVPRHELESWLRQNADPTRLVVLTSPERRWAAYAAAAIERYLEIEDVRTIKGGLAAWADSARPLVEGADGIEFEPEDEVPMPYHQGDWAKRIYLEWEAELGEKYV
jgi:rhodanese-related sulfurtransferase